MRTPCRGATGAGRTGCVRLRHRERLKAVVAAVVRGGLAEDVAARKIVRASSALRRPSTSTTSIRRHRSTWVPRTAGQDAKDMARNAAGKNPKIPGGDSDCRTAGADATNLAGYKRLTLPEGPRRFSPP